MFNNMLVFQVQEMMGLRRSINSLKELKRIVKSIDEIRFILWKEIISSG